MKLEQNETSFIFSTTPLSDIFFTEYISEAPGDYIKVYLYCLFLSKYNKDIKLNDLSKKLSLPLKTIQESLAYWEAISLITRVFPISLAISLAISTSTPTTSLFS